MDDNVTGSKQSGIAKFSSWYSQKPYVRAFVQLIPRFGGPLDTILSRYGDKIWQERIEDFIQKLENSLEQLGLKEVVLSEDSQEPIFDLFVIAIENVVKTRSAQKRAGFARIISNQMEKQKNWDEAELASTLLANLTEKHIFILSRAKAPDRYDQGYPHDKSLFIDKEIAQEAVNPFPVPKCLSELIIDMDSSAIRILCADLVAKNMLTGHSTGSGTTHEYFHITPTGEWFSSWITHDMRH